MSDSVASSIHGSRGLASLILKHDNSFWDSRSSAGAVVWVQYWVCAVMAAMVAGLIGGTVNLIVRELDQTRGDHRILH